MIFRQDLERLYEKKATEYMEQLAHIQYLEGRLHQIEEETGEIPLEKAGEYRDERDKLTTLLGWKQCLEYEIRSIDLDEIEDKVTNPLEIMRQ